VSTCWMRASGTSVRLIQKIPRCRSTSSSRISYRHRRHLRSGITLASTTKRAAAARKGRTLRKNGTSTTRNETQLTNAPTASSGSVPKVPVMRQRVFACGSSLSAGSAFKELLAREDCRTPLEGLRRAALAALWAGSWPLPGRRPPVCRVETPLPSNKLLFDEMPTDYTGGPGTRKDGQRGVSTIESGG
jgi:hypothetical protein